MGGEDLLGQVEVAVLHVVHRGVLGSPMHVGQVWALHGCPSGEYRLYDALRSCERRGLLRSHRDGCGRRYELTAAGRARLRVERRFRMELLRLLARSGRGTGSL